MEARRSVRAVTAPRPLGYPGEMSDPMSSGSGLPGLGDLFALLGTSNPLTSIAKTIDQFKRGVNEFLTAVENFNETIQTINALAARVTNLMDEVEQPIQAMMPQVMRSIKATDAMINQISGPIERVAPGISKLAETLGSPVFTAMPNEIAGFLDTLGDVAGRLQPLAQMAENAGSLFGLRPFGGLRSASRPAPAAPAPAAPQPQPAPRKATAATKTPAKQPAKKSPTKRS